MDWLPYYQAFEAPCTLHEEYAYHLRTGCAYLEARKAAPPASWTLYAFIASLAPTAAGEMGADIPSRDSRALCGDAPGRTSSLGRAENRALESTATTAARTGRIQVLDGP